MSAYTPKPCFRAVQSRELDNRAIAAGIEGFTLMQRAGAAAYRNLRRAFPRSRRLLIACGPGNNGGDGYVVARLALEDGLEVSVIAVADPATVDARRAAEAYRAAGGRIETDLPVPDGIETVIVDALLGTGLTREVDEPIRGLIERINAHPAGVLAIDLPSGLNADTGARMGRIVQATVTVTFITRKTGLYTGAARACCGTVVYEDLDLPQGVYEGVPVDAQLADLAVVQAGLPSRAADAHKGDNGKLLLVGGDLSMGGAICLAGEAAYAAGAGLVRLATHPVNVAAVTARRPELLVCGIDDSTTLKRLLPIVDAVALGPGLGNSEWSRRLYAIIMEHAVPVLIDADGLNLLAVEPRRCDHWVLTPHPGEAARLLGCTVADVNVDRPAAAREIVARYGGVCVLKGSGTLICDGAEPIWIGTTGNAGLASAGTGDVLAGFIGGLIAQGVDPGRAAITGVVLHGHAADLAVRQGMIGMLASDLLPPLRGLRNGLAG